MESQTFAKKNPGDKTADVHFARNMKCMDCHSAREIHGDGTLYDSLHAPGALDTRCENCHANLSRCTSNALHRGKVDCNACHVREVASCYNCHFDTQVSGGKGVSIPLKNVLFLINNKDSKVTAASLLTLVYQNKTFVLFAPSFPHSIMKEGRKCADCHATPAVQAMGKGTFKPIVWENGVLKNAEGVIPVLDGFKWNLVSLNYAKGQWAPIEKSPAEPLMSFSGYCKPITKEQFGKLAKPQPSKP